MLAGDHFALHRTVLPVSSMHDLQDLAKKKKIKTLGVSMGQGQEIIARKYMASATVEGQWVLLQNTHLGLGYLTEVGKSSS